jgi:hypothetical protein
MILPASDDEQMSIPLFPYGRQGSDEGINPLVVRQAPDEKDARSGRYVLVLCDLLRKTVAGMIARCIRAIGDDL